MRPRFRRGIALLFDAGLVVAVIFVVFVAYGLLGNRWYRLVVVTGGSMEPTITRGDLILVTPPPAQLESGMVVSMVVDGRLITHRVISVTPDGSLMTQGDANEDPDQWAGKSVLVVGQYQFSIPQLGRLLPISNATTAAFNWTGSASQLVAVHSWQTTEIPAECASMTFIHTIAGTDGDDNLVAGNGKSLVLGRGGNDTIAGGNGKDCLVGGGGNDMIRAQNGPDVLLGGPGDDILIGSNGPEVLDGGDGFDVCVAANGPATVRNCEADTQPATDNDQKFPAAGSATPQPITPEPVTPEPNTPEPTPAAAESLSPSTSTEP